MTHWPSMQSGSSGLLQATPHPEQLCRLVFGSTSQPSPRSPLQLRNPGAHSAVHTLLTQLATRFGPVGQGRHECSGEQPKVGSPKGTHCVPHMKPLQPGAPSAFTIDVASTEASV